MAEKMSTSLCNLVLGGTSPAGGSLRSIINGNWKLFIFGYTGSPVAAPATADTATTGSTLLCTVSNGGSAVNMAADPAGGVLAKLASETWSGTNAATGTATFYRFQKTADDNAADTGDGTRPRIQGTIGTGGTDLVVGSTSLTSGNPFAINYWTQAIVPS